jgi:asparagine synthase (glutamine-hydrolysing)
MCGICGIFDAEGRGEAHAPLVRRMSDSIAHRGPDNDGFYTSPHCLLGHRRLKVIDLSPLGRQPMANEDESLWLSFNGEIYNYLDLRPSLVGHGHRFRSQSDTEVMLHLYEDEGEDFLKQLNGMFALSLWDARRNRLLLARDRFGKKPIYYWSDGQRLLFASEIKALLQDPAVPRELDPQAVALYCALGFIPAPRTIFRGVHKLPPASYLVADRGPNGVLRLRGPVRYWDLTYRPDARLTETECTLRIREILRDAVRIRMFSDVPLGAFLSGGVDSSAVVAAMAQASTRPVETFSIGFDTEAFDETRFAEMVARKFQTRHHTFRCTPDGLAILPLLVHHFDEPFADASAIPTYYVSKMARQLVTVALSGDGGDEVFAGYARYEEALGDAGGRSGMAGAVVRRLHGVAAALWPQSARGWGYFYRNSLSFPASYAALLSQFQPPEVAALWSGDFRGRFRADLHTASVPRLFRDVLAGPGGPGPDQLSAMQFADQMLYLPEDILVKVDRASMAVALETRAPLLDYRLAEFMATVPAALQMKNGEKKYLLKKAMQGLLPDEILYRAKKGFSVPLHKWFRGDAAPLVQDTLFSQRARERGIFDPAAVRRLADESAAGRRPVGARIWTLLFFELWCQHWLDRLPAAAAPPAEAVPCLVR